MDPISQATLGALAARAVAPRSFCGGARAPVLLVGAAAGALPDIDVLFSIGGDFYDQLVTHRGITHSLFFAPVIGPLIGWLVHRYRKRRGDAHPGELGIWMLAATFALWSHPLLDTLTPYGTQLLLPFSDARVAVYAMPILEPIYTLMLCLGVFLAARLVHARTAALVTLLVSCSYLFYGWSLNNVAREYAAADIAARGVEADHVQAFPTILQLSLRRVVARTPTHDYAGYVSAWAPCPIEWSSSERAPEALGEAFEQRRDGRIFSWFTMGYTHYTIRGDQLVAADLKYGTETDLAISVFSVLADLDEQGQLAPGLAAGGRFQPSTDRVGEVFEGLFACTNPETGAAAG